MAPKDYSARERHDPARRPAPTPPGTARYDGVVIVRTGCDGVEEDWAPLMELARAWSLDYPALRGFIRDRTTILTERYTTRCSRSAGQTTVRIAIRVRHLARLHQELQRAAEDDAVENRD